MPNASAKDALTREHWLRELDKLAGDARKWAREKHWTTEIEEKQIDEKNLGLYSAKVLRVKTTQGELILEPIARNVFGADGLVDVYSVPALNRVRLLRNGNKWRIRTDSNVDLPGAWNKRNFLKLALELNSVV